MTVSASFAVSLIGLTLRDPAQLAALPRGLDAIARDDWPAANIAAPQPSNAFSGLLSGGVYLSATCREQWPFVTAGMVAAVRKESVTALRPSVNAFQAEVTARICAAWGAAPGPRSLHAPRPSPIPALVLAGAFDPVTPPQYGILAAKPFSRAYRYVFRDQTHGVVGPASCGFAVLGRFLEHPLTEPDHACVDALPGG